MKEDEVLLTPQEVATRLQVKPGWVYRHARKLGAYHLGKYLRFSWTTVLKAISARELAAEPNRNSDGHMLSFPDELPTQASPYKRG
jgi:hypothetical protein